MKALRVPVRGDIEAVEINYIGLFGDTATEIVRFGIPNTRQMYVVIDGPATRWVVMLCDDQGWSNGAPPNPRATILYRGGRHEGIVPGDVYLVMEGEVNDEEGGRDLFDIEPPYSEPAFWEAVVTV